MSIYTWLASYHSYYIYIRIILAASYLRSTANIVKMSWQRAVRDPLPHSPPPSTPQPPPPTHPPQLGATYPPFKKDCPLGTQYQSKVTRQLQFCQEQLDFWLKRANFTLYLKAIYTGSFALQATLKWASSLMDFKWIVLKNGHKRLITWDGMGLLPSKHEFHGGPVHGTEDSNITWCEVNFI